MIDLKAKQIELEKRGRELGAIRYDSRTEKAAENGRADETSFGATLVSQNVIKLKTALEEVTTPRPRYQVPKVFNLIKDLDFGLVSMVALSTVLGRITKATSATRLSVMLAGNLYHELRKHRLNEDAAKHLGNLLKKNGAQGRDALKTLDYISDAHEVDVETWSDKDKVTLGRALLEAIAQYTDLIEFAEGEIPVNAKKGARGPETVVATSSLTEWIANHRDEVRLLSPVYLPMVVKPRDWTAENVYNGAYLTNEQAPVPFTKRKKKKQMDRLKKENPETVFKAVNLIQSTAWRIRKPVLTLLKRIVDERLDLGIDSKSFPPMIDPELPEGATWKQEKDHKKKTQELENLRSLALVNLATAEEFNDFEEFFVPHHLDTRGRVYPIPALNPQGADYVKGLLEFSEGKRLGDAGIYWLKVHTANLFGVDKVPFEDRVAWVDQNWSDLLASAMHPTGHLFWTQADKPLQAFAACVELLGVSMEGADYVSRMPIALDGSCSGLQHLGAAFRCEVTGRAVNLIDAPKPSDIYQDVADKVQEMIEKETVEGNKVLGGQWLAFCGGKITRKITKRPVMTFPYGSKAPGFTQQLMDDIIKRADPETLPFDEPRVAAQYLANLIEKAVSATVLKAAEAMGWMQEAAKAIAAGGTVIEWTTPLGFPVVQEYRKEASRRIDSVVFGVRMQGRFSEELDEIDARKMANAISPNVVHSLDSSHLLLTVVRAAEEGISQFALIHDSFGTYAADTPRFFQIIREAFVEMYSEDVFSGLFDEFTSQVDEAAAKKKRKQIPELPTKGSLLLEAVEDSSFAFA
jgi:DNA-directed RNA polymerase